MPSWASPSGTDTYNRTFGIMSTWHQATRIARFAISDMCASSFRRSWSGLFWSRTTWQKQSSTPANPSSRGDGAGFLLSPRRIALGLHRARDHMPCAMPTATTIKAQGIGARAQIGVPKFGIIDPRPAPSGVGAVHTTQPITSATHPPVRVRGPGYSCMCMRE